jgi:hypothetical protein
MTENKTTKHPTPNKEASLETTSPERLRELANQNLKLARIVAKNSSAPPDLLAQLAHSEDKSIRKALRYNDLTIPKGEEDIIIIVDSFAQMIPPQWADDFIVSTDKDVRIILVNNFNTPVGVLEKLATDSDKYVRQNALSNPNFNQQAKLNTFNNLAKGTSPNLCRLAVFLSPYAEVVHLAENFRSTSWLERWAIAQNPNTPDNTLSYIIKDGNRLVRNAAELNIKQG